MISLQKLYSQRRVQIARTRSPEGLRLLFLLNYYTACGKGECLLQNNFLLSRWLKPARAYDKMLKKFRRLTTLEELKKFLSHELDELKENKIRAGALGVCFAVLLIFWVTDDTSDGEEIVLDDPPPLTKDFPVKQLPVTKSSDGVTKVLGANADSLFIGDPFAVEEKPKTPPPQSSPPLPKIPEPPVVIQPPPEPKAEPPKEPITLTGTAISGNSKTAMFLRGKETLFLTVGEEIDGRRIVDITPEFVTFASGECVYLQREMR